MTLKSFQARIRCDSPEQRRYLELTHRLFNEHLRPVLSLLYAALRGKHGPEYQRILATIRSAQQAHEHVEKITSLKSRPGTGGWKDIARQLLSQKRILFDREKLLPGFSSEFRRKIFSMAFQIILGHRGKLKDWKKEHQKWLEDKTEWEQDHPQYLAIRPLIQIFEDAEGQAAKRRGRWHRWLEFLSTHPQLAAWRGGEAHVEPLTQADREDAKRSRRKEVQRAFAMFFAKNPELEELDRLHGQYQREYVRPWAKRRHADGFKHAPTLTLPSAEKHPAWFSFKKNATYREVDLEKRETSLKVIESETPQGRSARGYVRYRFECDPRLQRFHRVEKPIKSGGETCELLYNAGDRHGPRPATLKGVKLVFRDGQPYLYFTMFIADAPSRITLAQASIQKYTPAWAAKQLRQGNFDPPLRTMAIDLGIRHIAAATVMEGDRLVCSRFIHGRPTLSTNGKTITGIASLEQIGAMKRELRRRLRQRGRPVAGKESCRRLSRHIRQMSEDRFKKAAVAIVDFAGAQRVDLIIMEELKGLIPDAERERGINRALVQWNRGQLCRWIQMLSEEQGLRVVEVAPRWTSQVCHRCNRLGARYTLREGKMILEPVGKLFGCPGCGYQSNADFNASINLHRVFWGTFPQTRWKKGAKGKVEQGDAVIDLAEIRQQWESFYQNLQSPF
jgi:IS605 OrfB family transposase